MVTGTPYQPGSNCCTCDTYPAQQQCSSFHGLLLITKGLCGMATRLPINERTRVKRRTRGAGESIETNEGQVYRSSAPLSEQVVVLVHQLHSDPKNRKPGTDHVLLMHLPPFPTTASLVEPSRHHSSHQCPLVKRGRPYLLYPMSVMFTIGFPYSG